MCDPTPPKGFHPQAENHCSRCKSNFRTHKYCRLSLFQSLGNDLYSMVMRNGFLIEIPTHSQERASNVSWDKQGGYL